jgi:hypothetical protein
VVGGRAESREVREQSKYEAEGEVAGLNTSSRAAWPCIQWASVLSGRASRFGGLFWHWHSTI